MADPCVAVHGCMAYEPPARDLLLRAKYGGDPHPLTALSLLLAELLPPLEADLIVPVPPSRRGLRRRGFDQVRPLARAVARETGVAVHPGLLRRRRGGVPQASLGRAQRQRNMRGRYRCKGRLDGGRVLLVDDVMTTGATLTAAGRSLLAAGAEEVVGVVLFLALQARPASIRSGRATR